MGKLRSRQWGRGAEQGCRAWPAVPPPAPAPTVAPYGLQIRGGGGDPSLPSQDPQPGLGPSIPHPSRPVHGPGTGPRRHRHREQGLSCTHSTDGPCLTLSVTSALRGRRRHPQTRGSAPTRALLTRLKPRPQQLGTELRAGAFEGQVPRERPWAHRWVGGSLPSPTRAQRWGSNGWPAPAARTESARAWLRARESPT